MGGEGSIEWRGSIEWQSSIEGRGSIEWRGSVHQVAVFGEREGEDLHGPQHPGGALAPKVTR